MAQQGSIGIPREIGKNVLILQEYFLCRINFSRQKTERIYVGCTALEKQNERQLLSLA